ncbi:hypothetical protein ACFL4A_01565 [bacterium]
MKQYFKKIANESGFAMPLMIYVLLVGVVLSNAVAYIVGREVADQVRMLENNKAMYIAEAGVHKSMSIISIGSTSYVGESDTSFGSGVFTVSVSTGPNCMYYINSTGYIPDTSNPRFQSSLSVEFYCITDPYTQPDIFKDYVVVCDGDISMSNNSTITCDDDPGNASLMTNGNLDMINSAVVNGNASVAGTITTDGGSAVTGDENVGVETVSFPAIDSAAYAADAQLGGSYSGNLSYTTGSNDIGPLYIDGDLILTNTANVTLVGNIYVTGSITVENAATLKGAYTVCGEGTICFKNNTIVGEVTDFAVFLTTSTDPKAIEFINGTEVIEGLFYAPNGGIVVENSAFVKGVVAADTVTLKNNANVDFMPVPNDIQVPGSIDNQAGDGCSANGIISWKVV